MDGTSVPPYVFSNASRVETSGRTIQLRMPVVFGSISPVSTSVTAKHQLLSLGRSTPVEAGSLGLWAGVSRNK
jgi:hypothetical protein